jgi:hypothetical protein
MTMLKVLILSIILIAISMVFLATQMLLRKGGKFPTTSIGKNKNMRELGITCPKCEEQARCALAKRESECETAVA